MFLQAPTQAHFLPRVLRSAEMSSHTWQADPSIPGGRIQKMDHPFFCNIGQAYAYQSDYRGWKRNLRTSSTCGLASDAANDALESRKYAAECRKISDRLR